MGSMPLGRMIRVNGVINAPRMKLPGTKAPFTAVAITQITISQDLACNNHQSASGIYKTTIAAGLII